MNIDAGIFPVSQYDAAALVLAHELSDTWLTRAEQERAASLGASGARFVAGRLLARQLASTMLQLPAEELTIQTSCATCSSTLHGTPELVLTQSNAPGFVKYQVARWAISISRSETHVLVGLVTTPRQQLDGRVSIGVDLTSTDTKSESTLRALDASFFEEEGLWSVPTRAQWWAMKEALGKARGTGIVPTVPNIFDPGGFVPADINRAHMSPAMPSVPGHVSCGVVLYEKSGELELERRQLFLK